MRWRIANIILGDKGYDADWFRKAELAKTAAALGAAISETLLDIFDGLMTEE